MIFFFHQKFGLGSLGRLDTRWIFNYIAHDRSFVRQLLS